MQIKRIPIGRITPASYNPRRDLKPTDSEYESLVRSLDEFGCVQPLVWNKRAGNLVGGHQRLKVLLARGETHVEVSVVDLDEAKEKALNLALNKISGDWDEAKLAAILDELLEQSEFDVALTGFEMPEIEELLESVREEEPPEPPEPAPGPPATKPGELIELGADGRHRLLCGDAADPAQVARLMEDQRARLCHTDPPYGVRYDKANRPGTGQSSSAPIKNDDLTPKRYAAWFAKICTSLSEALTPGASIYVWNAHKNFGLMHELLEGAGFHIGSVITWAKESASPGFGDYNEQVEYCLYGWRRGARHRWFGPPGASTLWQVRREYTGTYLHPTQKPLELAERAIRHSSQRDDIAFDPFLGSGTTLIGAARLGRRCFGMEIDPRCCDVIVRRYIRLAGRSAISPELVDRYLEDQEVTV